MGAAPARGASQRRVAVRRVVALAAIAALIAAVSAMVVSDGRGDPLSQADAEFMGAALRSVDQRVRNQLVFLDERGTAPALDRTRDALAATRSLAIVIRGSGGDRAERLRTALQLEARWLRAVGSTLKNPRSRLRAEVRTRDGALDEALAELPPSRRRGVNGVRQLLAYAASRTPASAAQKRAAQKRVAASAAGSP